MRTQHRWLLLLAALLILSLAACSRNNSGTTTPGQGVAQATPTDTPFSQPTSSPISQPNATDTPFPFQATDTPVPFQPTPTDTSLPLPTPTDTPAPPQPTPTDTPIPPPATASISNVSFYTDPIYGCKVSYQITNTSGVTASNVDVYIQIAAVSDPYNDTGAGNTNVGDMGTGVSYSETFGVSYLPLTQYYDTISFTIYEYGQGGTVIGSYSDGQYYHC